MTTSVAENGARKPPRKRDGKDVTYEKKIPNGFKALTPAQEAAIADSIDDGEEEDEEFDGDDEEFEAEGGEDEDTEDDQDADTDPGVDSGVEEEMEALAPPPPAKAPPRRGRPPAAREPREPRESKDPLDVKPSASYLRDRQTQQQMATDEDFASYLEGLDFSKNKHKVRVAREEPEYWRGIPIAGHLFTFNRPIGIDDLQRKYGGGTYRVIVYGPQTGSNRIGIKYNQTYTIVGDPILSPGDTEKLSPAQRGQDANTSASVEVVKDVLEKADRQMDRMLMENKELRATVTKVLSTPPPKDNSFIDMWRDSESKKAETARLEMEERRQQRAEDQRRFEAKQADDRLRWEKEREEARERRDREMELSRQQLEQAREDAKESREEARRLAESAEKEKFNSMQMMLTMVQNNSTTAMMQMQEGNRAMVAQMQQLDAMKTATFTELLKHNKQQDPLEQMLKTKDLLDRLQEGDSKDTRDNWDKAQELISNAVPSLVAAASAMRAGGAPPQAAAPQAPVQQAAVRRVMPGSVATVNVPRKIVAKRAPMTTPAAVPPPPFKFPEESTPMELAIGMLVENLEIAAQRDYSPQQMYADIVVKFPVALLDVLRATGHEKCFEMIAAQAPGDYLIASFKGAKIIEGLFKILMAAKVVAKPEAVSPAAAV